MLSAITALKKLCNHPKLIYDSIHSDTGNSAEGFEVRLGGGQPCQRLLKAFLPLFRSTAEISSCLSQVLHTTKREKE